MKEIKFPVVYWDTGSELSISTMSAFEIYSGGVGFFDRSQVLAMADIYGGDGQKKVRGRVVRKKVEGVNVKRRIVLEE